MIPKIIHRTVPQAISNEHEKFWDSFAKYNPDYKLVTWQDPLDEKEFELSYLWSSCGNGAQKADLIRLEVIYRHGGIYVDADMECIRSLPSLDDVEIFVGTEDGIHATNAVFGATKGHTVIRRMIDFLKRQQTLPKSIGANITTGPSLFTRTMRYCPELTVFPKVCFYPWLYNEKPGNVGAYTYMAHHWDGSWLKEGQKISIVPDKTPRDGFLARKIKSVKEKIFSDLVWILRKFRRKFPSAVSYPQAGALCVRTQDEIKILVDSKDISLAPSIGLDGVYESRETDIFKILLGGGDWFIDVGANCGYYTLLAAKLVGPFGRVIAFEPNEELGKLLGQSVIINWFQERVKIRAEAVSDKAGTTTFHVDSTITGSSSIVEGSFENIKSQALPGIEDTFPREVKTVRLDDVVPVGFPVRLVKIDVEGAEHLVFKGMSELLKNRQLDFVMFETLHEEIGDSRFELMVYIEKSLSYGYTLFELKMFKLKEISVQEWLYGVNRNYFLVEQHALKGIRELVLD